MRPINIIYFIWINPNKNFESIIKGQLKDMIDSNILDMSTLYIEVCCEYENIQKNLKNFIFDIINKYSYELKIHNKNHYEYYGIKKMYDLALIEPEKYYLYLHSKGMFNYNNIERHKYEKTLTRGTVFQYKTVIQKFEENENISKIGLFPSNRDNQNFMWLNFYWCRGFYLNTCKPPLIMEDRFYYERWSGTGEKNSLIYNLHEQNFKKYELNEVGDILNKLNGNYFLK